MSTRPSGSGKLAASRPKPLLSWDYSCHRLLDVSLLAGMLQATSKSRCLVRIVTCTSARQTTGKDDIMAGGALDD